MCVSSVGWPLIYFTHGAATLVAFALWLLVYVDLPRANRCISKVELQLIERDKSETQLSGSRAVPYRVSAPRPLALYVATSPRGGEPLAALIMRASCGNARSHEPATT